MSTAPDLIAQAIALLQQAQTVLGGAVPPGANDLVVRVKNGASLQAAIDAAQPGTTIRVEPGVYAPIVLREKSGSAGITIRTDADLPAGRIAPVRSGALIKLQRAGAPVLISTDKRAAYYHLIGFDLGSTGLDHSQVAFGDSTETLLADVPHHLTLDRCYLHGENVQRRGIELNSAYTDIVNNHIDGALQPQRDGQAICGWNGPGPFVIENNFLSGGTETVMFGGGDPAIPNLVPSDIIIRGNVLTHDLSQRVIKSTVKNTLELKNAQRVLIENNIIEHAWTDGQVGFLLLLTVRNQDHHAPWSTVRDVEVRYNVLRHGNQGISILGRDDTPGVASVPAVNINIHHNLIYDLDPVWGGGATRVFMISRGAGSVSIDHNTVVGKTGAFLWFSGTLPESQAPGLQFTNNIVPEGGYGISGDNMTPGASAFTTYAPGGTCVKNLIMKAGAARKVVYPPDNLPDATNLALDSAFRLIFTPAPVGTDGLPLGADIGALLQRIPGLDLTK